MSLEAIRDCIESDMHAVDAVIRQRLYSEVVLIRQVTEYIINSGGKRLRPALVLLSAGASTIAERIIMNWLPWSNSSIPQRCCTMTWSTNPACAVAARLPMRCSAMPPACWSATFSIRVLSR